MTCLNNFRDTNHNLVNEIQHDSKSNNNNNNDNQNTNPHIKKPITESEIIMAVEKIKNNKSHKIDSILNEHLTSTIQVMAPTGTCIYIKLLNVIFDSVLVPKSWTLGNILPIYKNKDNLNLPENYRPITLLSCFGK